MPEPKLGKSRDGRDMHYSVGALIERRGRYLLIDRVNPPYGFAGPAGHIDKREQPVTALKREVKEETELDLISQELLFEEEIPWNECKRGVKVHYWYLSRCKVGGKLKGNRKEAKTISWYDLNQIRKLDLEPVWKYWFEKLNLI